MPGLSVREHGYGSMRNPDYAYDTFRDRRDAEEIAHKGPDEERPEAPDQQSNQQ